MQMAVIKRFEDIKAWQKARELVREIYMMCAEGRLSKDFGLKDQICRAAVSSMSNVAEGFARNSDKQFAHFLDIARGSVIEVQSLLYVALDVGYIEKDKFEHLYKMAEETAALIAGFTSYCVKIPKIDTALQTPDSGQNNYANSPNYPFDFPSLWWPQPDGTGAIGSAGATGC